MQNVIFHVKLYSLTFRQMISWVMIVQPQNCFISFLIIIGDFLRLMRTRFYNIGDVQAEGVELRKQIMSDKRTMLLELMVVSRQFHSTFNYEVRQVNFCTLNLLQWAKSTLDNFLERFFTFLGTTLASKYSNVTCSGNRSYFNTERGRALYIS